NPSGAACRNDWPERSAIPFPTAGARARGGRPGARGRPGRCRGTRAARGVLLELGAETVGSGGPRVHVVQPDRAAVVDLLLEGHAERANDGARRGRVLRGGRRATHAGWCGGEGDKVAPPGLFGRAVAERDVIAGAVGGGRGGGAVLPRRLVGEARGCHATVGGRRGPLREGGVERAGSPWRA